MTPAPSTTKSQVEYSPVVSPNGRVSRFNYSLDSSAIRNKSPASPSRNRSDVDIAIDKELAYLQEIDDKLAWKKGRQHTATREGHWKLMNLDKNNNLDE